MHVLKHCKWLYICWSQDDFWGLTLNTLWCCKCIGLWFKIWPPICHIVQGYLSIVLQVDVVDHEHNEFFDPLRGLVDNATDSREDVQELESTSSEASSQLPTKEWMSFKRFLMQKFPVSKMVSISSVSIWSLFGGEIYVYAIFLTW